MTNHYESLGALYQAARPDEEPSRADRRAVRTAIMGAGIAAVTFHTSTAVGKLLAVVPGSAKLFTLGQLVTYTAVGVAIGGGIATVGVAVQKYTVTPAAVSSGVAVQQAAGSRKVQPVHSSESTQNEPVAPSTSPIAPGAEPQSPVLPARSHRDLRAVPAVSVDQAELAPPEASPTVQRAVAPQATSLMDESRGLAEVQVALSTGNVSHALQLLDRQDQAFAGGNLTQERAAARVIALCTAHRPDADVAKERFVAAYPGSPLVRRLNAACKNR